MPMKNKTTIKNFGKRLAELRKQKGLTQRTLAELIGVSERVIAYYEAESKYPPAHHIVPLIKALKVSADELLGVKNIKQQLNPELAKLWRRLKKAEQLSTKNQKKLFDFVEMLLTQEKIKNNLPYPRAYH